MGYKPPTKKNHFSGMGSIRFPYELAQKCCFRAKSGKTPWIYEFWTN